MGDLFDGGREWSTETSSSPEERWRRYGPKSWFNEYRRFSKIFVEPWIDNLKQKSPTFEESRKFIASLPGNHDIGLSRGIQLPVRNRFNAYFGDGNRVDIVANHTFVSVDTVSLSAWNSPELSEIWEPAMEFLDDASRLVDKRASSEVRRQYNNTRTDLLDQYVLNTTELQASAKTPSSPLKAEFPKILLSHVPLYRPPGTPCGPLREHWPPKSNVRNPDAVTTYDERNAIAVQAGYQYQNVLTDEVSHLLAKKIGDLEYVFSGDDHDYCDVIHQDYPSAGGGIRDITVKSISWAMGVRKPGFVMLSLWNPTDSDGKSTRKQDSARESRDTIQTHLCLLPDELGTFIRYAIMLASTLCILIAANASTVIYHTRGRQAYKRTGSSMGPESAHSSQSHESLIDRSGYLSSGEGRGASVSSSENSLRFAQETIARSRSVECAEHAFAADGYRRQPSMDPEKGMTKARHRKPSPLVAELAVPKSSLSLFYAQTARDIIRVGVVVGTFYLWLLWHMG